MSRVTSYEEFRMNRFLLTGLAIAFVSTACAADPKPESVIGTSAPSPTLTTLDGTATKFDSLRGKAATAVVFASFDCPVSASYFSYLNDLAKTHAEKGVAVVLVCPSDEARETVAKAAAPFKLTIPVLLDPKKEFAAGLKASITPEAFVLDAEGVVRYRGRIDDGYSARLKRNPTVTSFEVRDAVNSLLAGKPVAVAETKAIGCPIDIGTPAAPKAGAVTFYKDIAPILNSNCVVCHRAGELAPFALTSFAQARRWATDIKEFTGNKQMPPWPAGGGVAMRGELKLSAKDIATLAAWSDADAPEGDPKDAPKAPEFKDDGWRLGKPDLILTPGDDFRLAASGNDLFRVMVVPTKLTENKWVVGYDVKPGDPRVVHHTLNYFDTTGQGRDLEKKQIEKDKGLRLADAGPGYTVGMGVGFLPPPKAGDTPNFGGIGGWAPGQAPQFLPAGAGWLPKDSDFLIQMHYHRNGQFASDRTQVGLYFAKGPIDQPWQSPIIAGLKQWEKIPAGKADFQTGGAIYLHDDALLHAVLPHMHLLGKSVAVTMTPPGGKPTVLIDIPAWDYRWQETYWFKEPIVAKAGTKLEVRAVFDNSEANPNNPTKPPRDVGYGEQTTDEMLFVFFGATSLTKPSTRIRTYAFPPVGTGDAPVAGKMTPLLEEMVGTWETTNSLKVGGFPVNVKGKDVVEKVFDGKFVRGLATNVADDRGTITLTTFDPALDRYRMWMYDSYGTEINWVGTYDEKARAMVWKAELGSDTKLTQNWKFTDTGRTWDFTAVSGGKTTLEIKGEHTKKK
jgi:peroxiredoxin/mono/diheme cytochrome c family protein